MKGDNLQNMREADDQRVGMNTNKFFVFTILALAVMFITTGCDEGMNMTKPIMMEPVEEPMEPSEEPVIMMGDMKKPETPNPAEEPMEPAEDQKPEKPETPEPDGDQKPSDNDDMKPDDEEKPEPSDPAGPMEPTEDQKPEEPETPEPMEPTDPEMPEQTLTISITIEGEHIIISGKSTGLPEGTRITLTFAEDPTRRIVSTGPNGDWSLTTTSSSTPLRRIPTGTVVVTATASGDAVADGVTATSSFEHTQPEQTGPTGPEQFFDDPHFKRAVEIVKRINERYIEIGQEALQEEEETGVFPEDFLIRVGEMLEEETGIDYFGSSFVYSTLSSIYTDENPHKREQLYRGHSSRQGMIAEYLRLYFTYPDATKEQLLERFRRSCRDGNVSIEQGQFDNFPE